MGRVPEAEQTPEGPAYEGRLLARPGDEVVDQGAGFDARTLLTRRRMLSVFGIGMGSLALAACSSDGSGSSSTASTPTGSASAGTSDGELPEETNGPYPADGTNDVNILEQSGIVRSDITSSLDGGTTVEGVPLTLTFKATDMANDDKPFEGVAIYAWQCDAQGLYSMYSKGVENETYLRGVQIADSDGAVTFKTIVPGCYTGRWSHIHFEVYPDADSATDVNNAIATSQLAFPADMLAKVYALDGYSGSTENLAGVGTEISDDDIFAEGDWKLQVPTVSGNVTSGYTAELTFGVDTTTQPTRGGGGGDQPPGGEGQQPGGTPPSGAPSPTASS
ncbi:intradiol ring-cleavage dioxygenase [Streptomyces sp. AS02]|uniref:intradiol ring-cleavage dioxygenase n=1 Tax=Streptomyces sp. AS02 TaxID=2938946 RepID=UPI002020104F|nr:intradiol ring-cleavage dioxygenase [Streptomyces sp. AS02]MCL8014914.1 intradiol ring-cleavage dioxygenase [Streptomyces sp. AS02]